MIRNKYQLLPPLEVVEYENLKADIAANGVAVPIIYDENGDVLDGHHRLQICEELGIKDFPKIVKAGLTEAQKRSLARAVNIHRRHLNRAQRRSLIVDELMDNPTMPNLQIAQRLGVSDHTVAKIRKDLGLEVKVMGADGKEYVPVHVDKITNEKLVYSIVFQNEADYRRWMLLAREVKKLGRGKLISETLIDLTQNALKAAGVDIP